jgi:4-aminobutyrate aminotransferase-like enzyme
MTKLERNARAALALELLELGRPRASLGMLGALEIEAPAGAWGKLGAELAARKLSLHVDGKRGTAIFSPPLCITEQELVTGMRAFGDAAVAAFGAA